MAPFFKKIFLFLIPLSIVLLPVFGLIYSHEILIDCDKIIRRNEKYVFGLAYSEIGRQFKSLNVSKKEKFEVVALGSSRVMQFRAEMFSKSFYNAGGAIQSLYEFEDFLKNIPKEKLPNTLIIGLDQWMFNESYQKQYELGNDPIDWTNVSTVNENIVKKTKDFIKDYRSGKLQGLFEENGHQTIGISAKIGLSGFRNDGSYLYTAHIKKIEGKDTSYHDFAFKTTLNRIKKGCCRFDHGTDVDPKAILRLNELLSYCKENNIDVVAFLPPFATTISRVLTQSRDFEYMNKIYPEISPIFEKYNFELFDFSHFEYESESNDLEMVDGYHGGELTYSKIIISMIDAGSRLKNVADVNRLKNDLKHSKNNFIVYDY